jgi:hypothetical protein
MGRVRTVSASSRLRSALPDALQNPLAIKAGPELAERALAMIDEAAPDKLLREDPWSTVEAAFGGDLTVCCVKTP